jgi:transcriptional adapter 2-alpha
MQEIRDRNALLPGSDLPGFIPLREDFDFEHENDAELLLADMEFGPDDHPSERELKLQVMKKMREREREREKSKIYRERREREREREEEERKS